MERIDTTCPIGERSGRNIICQRIWMLVVGHHCKQRIVIHINHLFCGSGCHRPAVRIVSLVYVIGTVAFTLPVAETLTGSITAIKQRRSLEQAQTSYQCQSRPFRWTIRITDTLFGRSVNALRSKFEFIAYIIHGFIICRPFPVIVFRRF